MRDPRNPLAPFLENLPLPPEPPTGRSRRWLLKTASAVAALLGVGAAGCGRNEPEEGAGAGEVTPDPGAERLAGQIEAYFPYLKLDPEGVRTFAAGYLAHFEAPEAGAPLPQAIAEKYLLSTDFFDHGGDEARIVHYIALYDPYATPCSNRLAVLG